MVYFYQASVDRRMLVEIVAEVFIDHRLDDPLDFRHLYSVRRHSDSVRLSEVPGPVLIIASSGMCTGGRIVGHLQRLLPREETTVLFVGYQARGTTGRAIQEAARRGGSVWLGSEQVRVGAQIETLSGLSAHADRRELARWLDAIPDVKRVALHHGEVEAQQAFAKWATTLPTDATQIASNHSRST